MDYYSLSDHPGLGLEEVIRLWQEESQKLYDDDQPLMIPVRDLWSFREYNWTREDSRPGHLTVGGKLLDLTGEQKWDVLTEELKAHGWNKDRPLQFIIGRKGGAKIGEGNHRLAIARKLGVQAVPVSFGYYTSPVVKGPQHEPVERVSPKVVEKVLTAPQKKPLSPEEEAQIEELMTQMGFGKMAVAKRVALRYLTPLTRGFTGR